jgi:hypothetical protein
LCPAIPALDDNGIRLAQTNPPLTIVRARRRRGQPWPPRRDGWLLALTDVRVGPEDAIEGRFHGAIASIIIWIPANTFSISRCTRPVSDFKNSSSFWSSEVSPSSSPIEFEVSRAMEDRIRSASISIFCFGLWSIWAREFGISCSTKLLFPEAKSDCAEGGFSAILASAVGASINSSLSSALRTIFAARLKIYWMCTTEMAVSSKFQK